MIRITNDGVWLPMPASITYDDIQELWKHRMMKADFFGNDPDLPELYPGEKLPAPLPVVKKVPEILKLEEMKEMESSGTEDYTDWAQDNDRDFGQREIDL